MTSAFQHDSSLERAASGRRRATACAAVALGATGVAALHQLGVIRHLPDPPSPVFDSDKITGSPDARIFGLPDGVLGAASYAVTLALFAAGPKDRARTAPLLALAAGAKSVFDVAEAAVHSAEQWPDYHALCSWCLLASAATFAMAGFAAPEMKLAWKAMGRKGWSLRRVERAARREMDAA